MSEPTSAALSRAKRSALPLLVGLACLAFGLHARAQDDGSRSDVVGDDNAPANVEAFEQSWRIIHDQFYDRSFHGADWDGCRAKFLSKARGVATRRELHEVTLAMLRELKTSHTAIIEPDVYRDHVDNETRNVPVLMFGLELVRLDQGYFVSEIAAGSPAAVSGIARGDRLLHMDGAAPDDTNLRPMPWDVGIGGPRGYYPGAVKGKSVTFELERRPRASREGWNRYSVALTPASWSYVEATRASGRTVKRGEVSLGYVHVYHVLTDDVADIVGDLLTRGAPSSADGLVLDIRGKGGLTSVGDRLCAFFDRNTRGGPIWPRPVVCVVDGETRSAKEIMAWRWKNAHLGPIVGTRTRGAVIGSRFMPLPDGAYLMLANLDMRCETAGSSLEGKGVSPDVVVQDSLPYAAGEDACLAKAEDVLLDLVLAERRRGKVHGWY